MNSDDYKRSPSGRVPNWVIDEAHGRTPQDLVPFRAESSPSRHPAYGSPRPRRRWLRTSAWIAGGALVVAGGLYLNATDKGTARTNPLSQAVQHDDPDFPVPGTGESAARLLPAATAPASGSYRFSAHQKGSQKPVTWSPCRAVHYVVRPDNAPAGGDQLLAESFASVSQATGLSFVLDGTTTEAPTEDREPYQKAVYGDRWAPVLVTWATSTEVPDFGVDVVGEAGPTGYSTGSGDRAYVTGTVALDAVKLGAYAQRGESRFVGEAILHELGHLVGLAHVNDQGQVMYPRVGMQLTYGLGDLAGLAKLGQGPCQPDI